MDDLRPAWSHFPHSGDVGIRGTGPTLASAFEQTACALFAIVTDIDQVAVDTKIDITCVAPNEKLLLVDWLNALIYESSTRKMLFGKFAVTIREKELHGEAWGEAIDLTRHAPAVEPKGATFTELKVERGADGLWTAQCVIDV